MKTSSTSGTKPTAETKKLVLNADSICRILESCAKARVARFCISGLSVTFGTPARPEGVPSLPKSTPLPQKIPENAISAGINHDTQTKDAIEAEEIRLKQERLEQMFIENPLEAERMLMSGELEENAEEFDESETHD